MICRQGLGVKIELVMSVQAKADADKCVNQGHARGRAWRALTRRRCSSFGSSQAYASELPLASGGSQFQRPGRSPARQACTKEMCTSAHWFSMRYGGTLIVGFLNVTSTVPGTATRTPVSEEFFNSFFKTLVTSSGVYLDSCCS